MWKWLESTRRLQEESFGMDYDALKDEYLAEYITWNVTALVAEIGEFLAECGWKNWARPRGWVNREAAVTELVDAAHFLANLASALGVTDTEWEERYQAKQQVNRDRQANGYDGVLGKCTDCHRDITDQMNVRFLEDGLGVTQKYCVCGKLVP